MLQLQNLTPFKAAIAVLPDRDGVDTLFVVVKATLVLRPALALADEQVAVVLADDYYGEPALSSLRAASEMHIGKAGTDVVLIGSAWAPHGRTADRVQVTMRVAEREKTLLVSGDRVWRGGRPSSPKPFERMPLVWERAFGGFHRQGERIQAEERNPVGCGFAGGRSAGQMEGTAVPNIDDPAGVLQQLGQVTAPACLAPIAPSWLPRRQFAGTYDARWQRSRAPYLPDDFDPRFFQSAVHEFSFDRFLKGGEGVQLAGVTPEGPLAFAIPDGKLHIEVTVAGSVQQPAAHLETIAIEPDDNRMSLTWRAALPCDRAALKVERVIVSRPGLAGGAQS